MLAIKLRRIGKKHQAAFRVIVSEKRSKVDGRYVDNIGWLNPGTKEFDIKKEKAEYWIKNGAQPTDTVHNLLVRAGVIKGPKKSVHSKKKGKEEAQEKKPEPAVKEAEIQGSESEVGVPAETPEEKIEEKKAETETETEKPAEENQAQ